MFSRRPMCFLQRVISSTFSLHGLTAEPTWWAHSEWTLGKRARRRPPPAGRGAAGAGRPGSRASAARASSPSAPKRGGDPGRPKSPRGRRKTESRRFQGRGAGAARREPRARACACRSASPRRPQPQAGSVRHAEVAPPHTPGTLLVPRGPVRPPLPATDASPAGGSGHTCPGGGASAGRSEPAAAPSKPSRRRLGGSEGRDFHLGCARPGSLGLRAPVSFPLGRLSTEKCSLEPRSRTRSPTLAEGSEVAPLAESASSGLDRGSRPRPENLSPCSVARGEENRQLSSLKRPVNSRLSFVFYSCL